MKLIILSALVATTLAAPASQSLTFQDDGSYRFHYDTGKEGGGHSRWEVRNPVGEVQGNFSYEDPDGEIRVVNYSANEGGFLAQGDVGVHGAPKGQFPAVQEDQTAPAGDAPSTEAVDKQPTIPEQKDNEQQPLPKPQVRSDHDGSYQDGDEDHDEMQDLALEESSANDPPEAFPPGFFLQKFHGLRRLPEPTIEDKPASTTEASKEAEKLNEEEEAEEEKKEPVKSTETGPVEESVYSFKPVQPFLAPGIPHQEWASTMYHQPVYVFAYHQPDSYGYHYYF